MKIKLFCLLFFNVIVVFDSYSQWVKLGLPENEYVTSVIHYNNGLLASTTYKINENQYCKVYQSADCGDTWTEIYKTQLFNNIKMFAYKETVYFRHYNHNETFTIASTSDNFKTISSKEIPELWTREVYDFYVFDNNKILFAYNKGIGIYEQGVFQAVNLNKFGKAASTQINFYGGNVFVNYGESILISRDTCRTWQKYIEFKNRNCGNEKRIYFFEINGFDFLNNLLFINRGNYPCFGMYYCDTSKRDSIKIIETIGPNEEARPVVLENTVFGFPHYQDKSGIYYLDEKFKPIFLHSGFISETQKPMAIIKIISCNKSIIVGTSNGIYKIKKIE